MARYSERLQKLNEALARKVEARNQFDHTIQETEAAYMKVGIGESPLCQTYVLTLPPPLSSISDSGIITNSTTSAKARECHPGQEEADFRIRPREQSSTFLPLLSPTTSSLAYREVNIRMYVVIAVSVFVGSCCRHGGGIERVGSGCIVSW